MTARIPDLSIRERQAYLPEPRSLGATAEAISKAVHDHQELYGGTARMLRLHALPTAIPLALESHIYALSASGNDQAALETLLAWLDHDLRRDRFVAVDDMLRQLEVSRLGPAVLLAALTITHPAREMLRERVAFLERVEHCLRQTLGDDRAAALLTTRR
jgi:hypothetical protein